MSFMEDQVNLALRRAAVAQHMFCPVTQQVLDVKTAVIIESGTSGRLLAVLSPEGWARRGPALREAMPDIVVINEPHPGKLPRPRQT